MARNMSLIEAGDIGSTLKVADCQTFLKYNDQGELCGCYLAGAVLAVTDPSEWPELANNPKRFAQVLGEKFPNAPVEDITSWYIDATLGYMAPEEFASRIAALEPAREVTYA